MATPRLRLRILRPQTESVTPEQIGDAIVDFLGAARVAEILSGVQLRALDGGTPDEAPVFTPIGSAEG